MYTENVNKIALSINDDKKLQTFDRITTYPHSANAFKVCESEMLIVRDLFVESYAYKKRMQNKSISYAYKKRIQNKSLRLCKAVMMIKDYNISKVNINDQF